MGLSVFSRTNEEILNTSCISLVVAGENVKTSILTLLHGERFGSTEFYARNVHAIF